MKVFFVLRDLAIVRVLGVCVRDCSGYPFLSLRKKDKSGKPGGGCLVWFTKRHDSPQRPIINYSFQKARLPCPTTFRWCNL